VRIFASIINLSRLCRALVSKWSNIIGKVYHSPGADDADS